METGGGPARGRFVLLEHRWQGVHWDFMLESGDSLWTWAIDAPPAVGEDRTARRLADHRLEYLTYEGPISRDRGSVRQAAAGTYVVEVWEPRHIRVQVAGDQLVGEIDLSCAGSESDSRAGSIWTLRLGKAD